MLPKLLVVSLALAPSFTFGALFPSNSQVKMIDTKGFKAAMKENLTSVVAFVAPWCGHCKNLAPEYSRAALGLYPIIPAYAVDCDANKNKKLCHDQGIKGFPTIKLFPRGKTMKPVEYDGDRTASAIYYWATRGVPNKTKKLVDLTDITRWARENSKKPRALLMKKSNKVPPLWSALANKYSDHIVFAMHRDRRGRDSVKMGFEAGPDGQPKVLLYPAGDTTPVQYQGIMKLDSLSKFFDSIIDGTADLASLNKAAAEEVFSPDAKELEIEKEQEAEMLKLAHGGYADLIDFEQAIKDGHGKDFHGAAGYPGMMGKAPEDMPYFKKKEEGSSSKKKKSTPQTDDAGNIIYDPATETAEQPMTHTITPTNVAAEPEPTAEATSTVVEPAGTFKLGTEATPTATVAVKDEL